MNDQEPEFQDMLRGFDNKAYEMDRKLWEFGQLAKDMGVADIFENSASGSCVPKLRQSAKGKEWLKQFMTYLETDDVGGWRMRRMNDLTEPYWLEDPETPISVIRNHVKKGTDDVQGKVCGELSREEGPGHCAFSPEGALGRKTHIQGPHRFGRQGRFIQ